MWTSIAQLEDLLGLLQPPRGDEPLRAHLPHPTVSSVLTSFSSGLPMTQRGWVHIITAGEHGLRRGSWFAVLDDADPEHVVVEVNAKRVAVARSCVERHAARPLAWTVVVEAVNPEYFGSLYAVCPDCLARASVRGEELEMTCPSCGFAFPVDWSTAS